MPTRPAALASALVAAQAAALAAPAAAQTWVPFTVAGAQNPGKPPIVSINLAHSDELRTEVGVLLHGFWRETVMSPAGVPFERLTVPGLGHLAQVGAPDLPALRLNLATHPGATELRFDGLLFSSNVTYPGLVPLPTYVPGMDGDPTGDDTQGTEPQWAYDPGAYSAGPWPPAASEPSFPVAPLLGPVTGATVVVAPAWYDSATGATTVRKSFSLSFTAVGDSALPTTITKLRDEEAELHFLNWQLAKPFWPFHPVQYHARYLIVAQSMWWPTIEPFVQHKKAQGYEVSMVQADPDVDAIRATIQSWYQLGDPGYDHFALLVGDAQQIPLPMIFEPGVPVRSDDVYGCVGPLDQSKEVHVGRLSADTTPALAMQLQKIIDYELDPPPGDYDEALLVSHKEDPDTKYTASHEKVRTASYAFPPTFLTAYGDEGATNTEVFDQVNAQVGVVAYRGHGGTTSWAAWNTDDEDLTAADVVVECINAVRPVVWSITCSNANLLFDDDSTSDSIAEAWMEAVGGAVASYGATRTTSTTPNHLLNETLFQVVFDHGVTTHGKTLDLAEQTVWAAHPGHMNPWAYLLLGDPSMTVRRGAVVQLGLAGVPSKILMDKQPAALTVTATGAGDAFEEGLVSAYKASFFTNQPDELLGAYWLDANLQAQLPISFATPGTLYLTLREGNGNQFRNVVPVAMANYWIDLGHALAGAQGEPRLAGIGEPKAGATVSLLLADARPSSVAVLCVAESKLDLPIFGGTLVPDVLTGGLVMPFLTDKDGNHQYSATWPSAVPQGQLVYFQYWMFDAAGPQGFAASNGLRAKSID